MTEAGTEPEEFGPTDYVVVEFAENSVPTEGFATLLNLVEAGAIDPDHIHTPGIFVKRLVHVPNAQKRIEQRTVRKRAA